MNEKPTAWAMMNRAYCACGKGGLRGTRKKHAHHWSYAKENATDVIYMTSREHRLIHGRMIFNEDTLYYQGVNSENLDTKEKAIRYYARVLSNEVVGRPYLLRKPAKEKS